MTSKRAASDLYSFEEVRIIVHALKKLAVEKESIRMSSGKTYVFTLTESETLVPKKSIGVMP